MSKEQKVFFKGNIAGPQLPNLEHLAKDFYEKNNFNKPEIQRVSCGLMIHSEDMDVLLREAVSQEGSFSNPSSYIGSNKRYWSTKINYVLEGILENRTVFLDAAVVKTLDFLPKEEESSNFGGFLFQNKTIYVPDFKNERIDLFRNDNEKYWFVLDANKE